jgi:hypothetical protein
MISKPKATISPDQAALLKGAFNALKPFRLVREEMPLQYVTLFLLIAANEGHNMKYYAKMIESSDSLISRHVADLGTVNRYHEEGFGLIETYDDLTDRRNKFLRLTGKGRRVVEMMCLALGGVS